MPRFPKSRTRRCYESRVTLPSTSVAARPTPARRSPFALLLAAGARAAAAVACAPLVVMTSDTGSTKQLELDEARSRCGRGEPCACYAVGVFRAKRGDNAEARQMLDRGCGGGCAPSCADLSDAYFDGRMGAKRDPTVGTRYAIRACKLEARWCADAGERFEMGSGPRRDIDRARAFYSHGCRNGAEGACRGLERVGEPDQPKSTGSVAPPVAEPSDAGAAPAATPGDAAPPAPRP